jgi:uncharacterized membrane protein
MMAQAVRTPFQLPVLGTRWRAPLGGLIGLAAGVALRAYGLKSGISLLLGWDAADIVFLTTTGVILFTEGEEQLKTRACFDDEGRPVLGALVILSVAFAFAAVIIALREAHDDKGGGGPWLGVLAIATLILSWLSVQALFTLHYAHRYFGDPDDNGKRAEGLKMTGDPPRTYRDFLYISVCIGACFQVSDFGPTNTQFRNLITTHALIAFAFNALVIALGVGIVGDLLKG